MPIPHEFTMDAVRSFKSQEKYILKRIFKFPNRMKKMEDIRSEIFFERKFNLKVKRLIPELSIYQKKTLKTVTKLWNALYGPKRSLEKFIGMSYNESLTG